MLRQHVADIAPDHFFQSQRLLSVLLCTVVVIVMNQGTAAVVPKFCRRHRLPFQIAAQIFDASPGSPGFLRKVDLHAASLLRLQISIPLIFVPDVSQPRQAARINQIIAVAQQADVCTTPDFLDGVLLKEYIAPDAVFHIESTASDGQVNVRMLVELATVGVQGAEDIDLHALSAGPA